MNSSISKWLNSGQYVSDISEICTQIIKKCNHCKNEASTASIFENELYFIIRKQTEQEIIFEKEKRVNGIEHRIGKSPNKGNSKRLDAIVNNLVIEYKHYSKLKTNEQYKSAIKQIEEYLISLQNDYNIQYNAILTDGIQICYFMFVGNTIKHSSLKKILPKDIDLIIQSILSHSYKKFTAENILSDFKINTTSPSISKSLANVLYFNLNYNLTEKTEMLFEEWKCLMHLSVDDNGKSNDIKNVEMICPQFL